MTDWSSSVPLLLCFEFYGIFCQCSAWRLDSHTTPEWCLDLSPQPKVATLCTWVKVWRQRSKLCCHHSISLSTENNKSRSKLIRILTLAMTELKTVRGTFINKNDTISCHGLQPKTRVIFPQIMILLTPPNFLTGYSKMRSSGHCSETVYKFGSILF